MFKLGLARSYVALASALVVSSASYAVSPADKCESTKLDTAGKYDFCRLKAEAKAARVGCAPDFTKCDPKFSGKWTQAETNGGGMCPSNGEEAAVQAFITEHTDALEAALDGGTLPEGVLSCNADLASCNMNLSTSTANLATCTANLAACAEGSSSLPLKTEETTAYGTGSDGDLQRGIAHSYTDDGDGTITDNKTGLMWEKKSQDSSIHDYRIHNNTWATDELTNLMDGTITTAFLAGLNAGGGFAGHTDWRIPNVNELHSLENYENSNPSVDAASTRPA